MRKAMYEGEFSLADVKRNFYRLVEGDNPFTGSNARVAENLCDRWRDNDHFYGASLEDMVKYAKEGYALKGADKNPSLVPQAHKRKFQRSDEGELILEAAYNGEDFPFIEQTKRPAKPGLRIVAEFCTLASTPPEELANYGRFLGEVAVYYQSKGYDLALSLSQPGRHRFGQGCGTSETLMVLKREGIIADPIEWSVMFSPGGYRYLGFLSHIMLAEQIGKTASTGMGNTNTSGEFGASFDRLTRTLRITVPTTYSKFPVRDMRDKLERLGI